MPNISSSPPATAGARPRVLVVDDSRVIRSAIKKILDEDFDVVLAESGDVAWGFLAREHDFKMLVTDIEMPGIDGYELICRVRGADQGALKSLPILTITGAEDEQTKERAFACGATDFITKPIDPIQLKARARSYMQLDQSAREMAEKASKLEEQAINDPLTGLRSKRYFLQRGTQDLAYCSRNRKDLTVVRFDIDRYKEIYRKFGDEVGDRILVWLAGIVSANARLEDTIARVGGAKFAVLASSSDIDDARQLCQRLRDAAQARPFMHNGEVIELTLSFGLASFSREKAEHIEPLLSLADDRVNRAQQEGGNRLCVSVLGEAAPNIEEVVLDEPPPAEPLAEAPVFAPSTEPVADSEPVLAADDVASDPFPPASPATAPEVTLDQIARLVSVDKALQLIATDQGELLDPYLDALARQLKPLLDLIARQKS